ncbi:MAG: hypothetical protein PHG02_09150, partial [Oscillospiraceae bacterium]|nr:hypothetical protein [Oscillospiraceae bacterium]
MDRSKIIFENEVSDRDYKKALKAQKKFIKKFGDDRTATYHLAVQKNETIGNRLGVKNLALTDEIV